MPLTGLRGNILSYDTETTGLNPWNSVVYKKYGMKPARPFAFAFHDAKGNKAFIRWEVNPKNREVIPVKKEAKLLSDILGDPNIIKVGHNISFDIRMTRLSGIDFDWTQVHDTQFMARILTGGSLFSYQLKPLAKMWLGMDEEDLALLMKSVLQARRLGKKNGWAISNKETHGKEHVKSDMWLGDHNLLEVYGNGDSERTILIFLGMYKFFSEEPDLLEIYNTEIKLMRNVYRAETYGVRVFPDKLISLRKFYQDYCNKWKTEVNCNGGKGLNLSSPVQLVNLFCKQRKYVTKKRTDAGNPSVDAAELARLAKKDTLAKAILEYKAGESMLTKFINSYEKFMAPQKDFMVLHANFHQMGTNTARFSCSDPNLEQVAAEDSAKKKADISLRPREALGARPGHLIYLPDYSQMEVWVFAFQSQDKILMEALMSGQDVHAVVANLVWGFKPDYEENKKLYRKKGKTMMFLKIYGGTAKAAMDLMDCTRDEAQEAIDDFDIKFPGVNEFLDRMSRQAETQGYIKNAFGRQYYIDPHRSYIAVNYLVQGTCADVVKRAMNRLSKYFINHCEPSTQWLLPIHDELFIEVHKKDHSRLLQSKIIDLMQRDSNMVGVPIPLPVSMKVSDDYWSNAKEIKP